MATLSAIGHYIPGVGRCVYFVAGFIFVVCSVKGAV